MPDYSDLWVTAEELCSVAPEVPPSAIEQIAILGAITELTANIKAGKTTFIGAALRALFGGDDFIGLKTTPMDVLYLTEEGPSTFSAMLRKTGLDHETRLHVLHRGKVWRMHWPDIVTKVVLPKMEASGARFVFVDTISRWAGIKGDEENQTGPAQVAMIELEKIRDLGHGVMIIRHARKAGGEIGESGRGASAWGGAADVLLQITNPATHGHMNRRVLESLGRFDDPGKWTIDLEEGHYRLVSRGDVAEREHAKEMLVALHGSGEYTLVELEKLLDINRQTIDRALQELLPAGQIRRLGEGKRGDPYRYAL